MNSITINAEPAPDEGAGSGRSRRRTALAAVAAVGVLAAGVGGVAVYGGAGSGQVPVSAPSTPASTAADRHITAMMSFIAVSADARDGASLAEQDGQSYSPYDVEGLGHHGLRYVADDVETVVFEFVVDGVAVRTISRWEGGDMSPVNVDALPDGEAVTGEGWAGVVLSDDPDLTVLAVIAEQVEVVLAGANAAEVADLLAGALLK